MKKLLVLGIGIFGFSTFTQAAWIKSVSSGGATLAVSLEQPTPVLGTLTLARGEAQVPSLSLLSGASVASNPVRWQDSPAVAGGTLQTATSDLFVANQFIVPEASTWAAGAVLGLMAFAGWRSRIR